MDDSALLTEQLQRFSGGDRDVAEAVLQKVLPELHRIAVRELRRERYLAPCSATELIHEVWLQSLQKGVGRSAAARTSTLLPLWRCAGCW